MLTEYLRLESAEGLQAGMSHRLLLAGDDPTGDEWVLAGEVALMPDDEPVAHIELRLSNAYEETLKADAGSNGASFDVLVVETLRALTMLVELDAGREVSEQVSGAVWISGVPTRFSYDRRSDDMELLHGTNPPI